MTALTSATDLFYFSKCYIFVPMSGIAIQSHCHRKLIIQHASKRYVLVGRYFRLQMS